VDMPADDAPIGHGKRIGRVHVGNVAVHCL
jgi:hypothetical protein